MRPGKIPLMKALTGLMVLVEGNLLFASIAHASCGNYVHITRGEPSLATPAESRNAGVPLHPPPPAAPGPGPMFSPPNNPPLPPPPPPPQLVESWAWFAALPQPEHAGPP